MLKRELILARDFFSTILDTTAERPPSGTTATPGKESSMLSSSPGDTTSKKRTRAALKSLQINDGSPEKDRSAKPPRKASRASISSSKSDQENVLDLNEGQENMMVDV